MEIPSYKSEHIQKNGFASPLQVLAELNGNHNFIFRAIFLLFLYINTFNLIPLRSH